MEQFTPDIRIIAVDQDDVIVMFDTGHPGDAARAIKTLRITRKFSELSITVDPFVSHGELGDQKEYRSTISLVVKDKSGIEAKHTLAEPVLWINARGKNGKRGKNAANQNPYIFYTTDEVGRTVRTGMANALARALVVYYGKESLMDTAARAPVQHGVPAIDARPMVAATGTATNAVQSFAGSIPEAANDRAEKKRFHKKVITAAVVTPLVVFGLLWLGGAVVKKNDPIQDAVAHAMRQDPRSMQAQVELTKETLKQMGLDPGKAGDVGCLAP